MSTGTGSEDKTSLTSSGQQGPQGRVLGECTCPSHTSPASPPVSPPPVLSGSTTLRGRSLSGLGSATPGKFSPSSAPTPGKSSRSWARSRWPVWVESGRWTTRAPSTSSTATRSTLATPGPSSSGSTWRTCARSRLTTGRGGRKLPGRRACSTGSTPTTTGWGTDPFGVAPGPSAGSRGERGYPYIHTRALRGGYEM